MVELSYLPFTNHCRVGGFDYCTVRIAKSDQVTGVTATRLIAAFPNYHDAGMLVSYLDKLRQAAADLTNDALKGIQVMLVAARRAAKANGWLAAGEPLFAKPCLPPEPFPIAGTVYEALRETWQLLGIAALLQLKTIDALVIAVAELAATSLPKPEAEGYLNGVSSLLVGVGTV